MYTVPGSLEDMERNKENSLTRIVRAYTRHGRAVKVER
jgi:hypothetical protein